MKTSPSSRLQAPVTNGAPRFGGRRSTRWYWAAGALGVVIALSVAFALRPKAGPQIATSTVLRKTLDAVVTATGTVNPQDTISVGTQVSGTIQTIVADYNDPVHEGQVLARLDPTLFQAALDQARGTLAQAQGQWLAALANARGASSTATAAYASADAAAQNVHVAQDAVISADADVTKAEAALVLAQKTLTRDRELLSAGFIAQSQYDTDDSNQVAGEEAVRTAVVTAAQARMQLSAARSQAAAGTAQGDAAAAQAAGFEKTAASDLAAIAAAQAAVRQATINLEHTVIVSPVNGTVIARNVSIGQTVAASFQTPTLYTIAKDLAKMEIDLAVGEPDVGTVRAGEPVDFTVLAYPNHVFHGTVAQVRENPTTLQNVVTYDTVVYERNADGRLRPGMTANASIRTARAADALVVPVEALRFRIAGPAGRPASNLSAPVTSQSAWGNTGSAEATALTPGAVARIAVVAAEGLRAVPVRITLISGGEAAIVPLEGGVGPGTRIAVSVNAQGNEIVTRAPGMLR